MTAHSTVTLTPEIAQAAALVGTTVHFHGDPHQVHSVEGRTWYAFDQDGQIVIDLNMTGASWITVPQVTLVPEGAKIGEGFSFTADLDSRYLAVGPVSVQV